MTTRAKRRTRRPVSSGREVPLSRELIVETALEIVREVSLPRLTLRLLAERLGATPMAMYKHVDDRDELALLVVERSFAGLTLPSIELPPREWLARVAKAVRTIGLTYPGVMDYLLDHGPVAEPALRIFDRTVALLHAAGLGYREAGELHNTFFSWLAGSIRRQHGATAADPKAFRRFLEVAARLSEVDYPALHKVLPQLETVDFDREFNTSLRLLLDAIGLRVERQRSR
jgi:AcrR family transcriptional regulator